MLVVGPFFSEAWVRKSATDKVVNGLGRAVVTLLDEGGFRFSRRVEVRSFRQPTAVAVLLSLFPELADYVVLELSNDLAFSEHSTIDNGSVALLPYPYPYPYTLPYTLPSPKP